MKHSDLFPKYPNSNLLDCSIRNIQEIIDGGNTKELIEIFTRVTMGDPQSHSLAPLVDRMDLLVQTGLLPKDRIAGIIDGRIKFFQKELTEKQGDLKYYKEKNSETFDINDLRHGDWADRAQNFSQYRNHLSSKKRFETSGKYELESTIASYQKYIATLEQKREEYLRPVTANNTNTNRDNNFSPSPR